MRNKTLMCHACQLPESCVPAFHQVVLSMVEQQQLAVSTTSSGSCSGGARAGQGGRGAGWEPLPLPLPRPVQVGRRVGVLVDG
jgi:hypothetical protein